MRARGAARFEMEPDVQGRDDAAYFQQRAEQQIELALRARDGRVVQAHYDLASAYLDRAHGTPSNDNEA